MCVLYCVQKLIFIGTQIQPDASMVGENVEDGQVNQRNFIIHSGMLPMRSSIMALSSKILNSF